HPSSLAHVDRLSRHPGRVHARESDQLFREQPARHLRPAAVCHAQSKEVRWVWPVLLGHYGERWSWTSGPASKREEKEVSRVFGTWCSLRSGRRDVVALGRRSFVAVRARSGPAYAAAH